MVAIAIIRGTGALRRYLRLLPVAALALAGSACSPEEKGDTVRGASPGAKPVVLFIESETGDPSPEPAVDAPRRAPAPMAVRGRGEESAASRPAAGGPLPGSTEAELDRFREGREEFSREETVEDGLGPVFNGTSCVSCHSVPVTGGGSARTETRFGADSGGAFDPLVRLGGSLIQEFGIGKASNCEFAGEVVPAEATVVALRRTTPLFGLGLVDAVPDAVFHRIAEAQREFWPETAGRPSLVEDLAKGRTAVGKFGWKAQVPSLFQFAGDAYLNEMGITSPQFPGEHCPQGDCALLVCNPVRDLNDDGSDVAAFTDFMTFLDAPPRGARTVETFAGAIVFTGIGCARCHLPALRTGPSAVKALDRVVFHPYSDFLLHDMGSLGDGIEQGSARGREMRTAPLWGASLQPRFLHDGRAASVEEAILAHDGQGRSSRRLFEGLERLPYLKEALIAFLGSL